MVHLSLEMAEDLIGLNSSQDGKEIYYEAGFKMKDNEMELFLS